MTDMTELVLSVTGIIILVLGALVTYTLPRITEQHYHYKEKLLEKNRALEVAAEETKREQIKVAQEIARKEQEEERTKQLQIKADYKKEHNSSLY